MNHPFLQFITLCVLTGSFSITSIAQENAVSADCQCVSTGERKYKALPLVDDLLGEYALPGFSGWSIAGKSGLNGLFYTGLQINKTDYSSYQNFTMVSYVPVRLVHPGNTYTINLTPCVNPNKIYTLPVTFRYEYRVRQYLPKFDYTAFDRSAPAYFSVLKAFNRSSAEDLMFQAFFAADNTAEELNRVNKLYQTSVNPDETDYETAISDLLKELESKNNDPFDVILNAYVLQGNTQKHTITKEEQDRLQQLFPDFLSSGFESLEKAIRPKASVEVGTKKFSVEIDPKRLRAWDEKSGTALKDSVGKFIPATILLNAYPDFNTTDGLNALTSDICQPPLEITGTGILVTLDEVRLIGSYSSSAPMPYYYPLFLKKGKKAPPTYEEAYQHPELYDPLLTEFSGLMVNGKLRIPVKAAEPMNLETYGLWINNAVVFGILQFKPEALKGNELPENIRIDSNGKEVIVSLAALKKRLSDCGIKETFIWMEEGMVMVNFRVSTN